MARRDPDDPWRNLVEECLRRETGKPVLDLAAEQDLIEIGVLDSMGWVSFLRTLESASGFSDLGAKLNTQTSSIESVLRALNDSHTQTEPMNSGVLRSATASRTPVALISSASCTGRRSIPSEEVDRAFGMPIGKLRKRAGIERLAHVGEGEDELTLAVQAAQGAQRVASCGTTELDWIVASSETHRRYPSLAAQLHSQLLARESCGALDVGGACLGLLNGFAVAQGLMASGQAKTVLVVTADVHSRILKPGIVAGEFGGLFGDAASAFLLRGADSSETQNAYRLGEFLFGCAGQYAGAIRVAEAEGLKLEVHFDGEALSRAAITRLERVIGEVELRSGIARTSLAGLATHQPNPRLVSLLAKQCGVPEEKFPTVARIFGNLGSSTCGVALDLLLSADERPRNGKKAPIFLASLGPGLLYGGGWLS